MWKSFLARHKTSLKTVIEARRHESRGEKAGKTEQTRHQERFLVSIRRVIRFERRRLLFTGTRVNSPRILIHEKFRLPICLLGSLLILIQAGDYLKRRGGTGKDRGWGTDKGITKTGRVRSFWQKVGKQGFRSIHLIILPCVLSSHLSLLERTFQPYLKTECNFRLFLCFQVSGCQPTAVSLWGGFNNAIVSA